MSDQDYNPKSTDAMFARIEARLLAQDSVLAEIRDGVKTTNGRVTDLEREKWYVRGVTAAIAVFAGGAWEWWRSRQ